MRWPKWVERLSTFLPGRTRYCNLPHTLPILVYSGDCWLTLNIHIPFSLNIGLFGVTHTYYTAQLPIVWTQFCQWYGSSKGKWDSKKDLKGKGAPFLVPSSSFLELRQLALAVRWSFRLRTKQQPEKRSLGPSNFMPLPYPPGAVNVCTSLPERHISTLLKVCCFVFSIIQS